MEALISKEELLERLKAEDIDVENLGSDFWEAVDSYIKPEEKLVTIRFDRPSAEFLLDMETVRYRVTAAQLPVNFENAEGEVLALRDEEQLTAWQHLDELRRRCDCPEGFSDVDHVRTLLNKIERVLCRPNEP